MANLLVANLHAAFCMQSCLCAVVLRKRSMLWTMLMSSHRRAPRLLTATSTGLACKCHATTACIRSHLLGSIVLFSWPPCRSAPSPADVSVHLHDLISQAAHPLTLGVTMALNLMVVHVFAVVAFASATLRGKDQTALR